MPGGEGGTVWQPVFAPEQPIIESITPSIERPTISKVSRTIETTS
jgi:hypothetical protein